MPGSLAWIVCISQQCCRRINEPGYQHATLRERRGNRSRCQRWRHSYGPARKSANATEILYKDGKTVMGPNLPTAAANMTNALETSSTFWVDKDAELNERFNAWLATN